MRLRADENLPAQLVQMLRDEGHDVALLPGPGASDVAVLAEAGAAGRFVVVTEDRVRCRRLETL